MGVNVNGDDGSCALVADHANLRLTTWGLECCFRLSETVEASPLLITKGTDLINACNYYLGLTSTHIAAGFTASGVAYNLSAAYSFTLGRWYSAAVFRSNGTKAMSLWVAERMHPPSDTQVAAYTQVASTTHPGTTPYTGSEPVNIGYGFNGTISEVRIYNNNFSQATLESRLGTRLVGTETGLVGCWRFDDGLNGFAGSTAYDRSQGNGRNATLRNGAWWADDPPDLYYPSCGIGPAVRGFFGWHTATQLPATTIAGSSEATGYPATNLRCQRQQTVTRTANVTGAKTWTFGFGQPRPIWAFSLFGHNLTSAATISISLHTADSWGAPAVTETVTFAPGRLIHCLTRPYAYAFARLSITDANNPAGYIELGRVDWWDGVVPFDQEPIIDNVSIEDMSAQVETSHGARTGRSIKRRHDLGLSFYGMRLGQAQAMRRALNETIGGAPVLVVPDARRCLYTRALYGMVKDAGAESPASPSWDHVNITGVQFEADMRAP